ncbi:MAG: hypothetical protein SGJ20_20790 [Planctomycetota bacterium]|nr:hypothetical protein [Planctomycetota bacterium]
MPIDKYEQNLYSDKLLIAPPSATPSRQSVEIDESMVEILS